ncbi:MAG: amidohydrolase family protein [Planctomycetes bacterium]|nr:amidohydrolase family protein [Planctomycetota bacterium]
MIRVLALILVTSIAGAQDLLVKNARVITCAGSDLKIGCVLIKGGKIAEVGEKVEAAGVPVIDGRGKVVMPGFVLPHTSAGLDGRNQNEMVPVTPYVSVLDAIDPSLPFFEDCLRDGNLSICVMPGNRTMIAGMGRVVRPWGATVESMTVAAEPGLKISVAPTSGNRAAWIAKLRAELEKGRRALEKQELEGKVGDNERTGNIALDLEAMGAKKRQLALFRLLKGDLRAHVVCQTAGDVLQAQKLAAEFKLKTLLVCGPNTWRAAKHLAKEKIPVVLSSTMVIRETDTETGEEIERIIPKIFHDAGVKFAITTSTGNLGGRYAWYQAACLVRYGMSREDALAAVTRIPAELIGIGARKGSIEPGKDGDVLILTDDPLSGRAWVEQAVIGGEVVYERSRAPRLAEVFGGGK